jgi:hypothetical protein
LWLELPQIVILMTRERGTSSKTVYYFMLETAALPSLILTALIVCAMAQAVSRRPLTAEARVRSQVRAEFLLDKVALGQVFPRVLLFSPVNFIPPVLRYTKKRSN